MPNEVIFSILLMLALFSWFGFVHLHFEIKSVKNDLKFLEEFHLKYIKDDIERLNEKNRVK